jgi:hypothetical protein
VEEDAMPALRPGLQVFDRSGVNIGRIDRISRADPLAVADDGRRIAEQDDLVALLPGRHPRQLPLLPPAVATRLTRDGYVRISLRGDTRHYRYAALTDVDLILDEGVYLRLDAADVPLS